MSYGKRKQPGQWTGDSAVEIDCSRRTYRQRKWVRSFTDDSLTDCDLTLTIALAKKDGDTPTPLAEKLSSGHRLEIDSDDSFETAQLYAVDWDSVEVCVVPETDDGGHLPSRDVFTVSGTGIQATCLYESAEEDQFVGGEGMSDVSHDSCDESEVRDYRRLSGRKGAVALKSNLTATHSDTQRSAAATVDVISTLESGTSESEKWSDVELEVNTMVGGELVRESFDMCDPVYKPAMADAGGEVDISQDTHIAVKASGVGPEVHVSASAGLERSATNDCGTSRVVTVESTLEGGYPNNTFQRNSSYSLPAASSIGNVLMETGSDDKQIGLGAHSCSGLDRSVEAPSQGEDWACVTYLGVPDAASNGPSTDTRGGENNEAHFAIPAPIRSVNTAYHSVRKLSDSWASPSFVDEWENPQQVPTQGVQEAQLNLKLDEEVSEKYGDVGLLDGECLSGDWSEEACVAPDDIWNMHPGLPSTVATIASPDWLLPTHEGVLTSQECVTATFTHCLTGVWSDEEDGDQSTKLRHIQSPCQSIHNASITNVVVNLTFDEEIDIMGCVSGVWSDEEADHSEDIQLREVSDVLATSAQQQLSTIQPPPAIQASASQPRLTAAVQYDDKAIHSKLAAVVQNQTTLSQPPPGTLQTRIASEQSKTAEVKPNTSAQAAVAQPKPAMTSQPHTTLVQPQSRSLPHHSTVVHNQRSNIKARSAVVQVEQPESAIVKSQIASQSALIQSPQTVRQPNLAVVQLQQASEPMLIQPQQTVFQPNLTETQAQRVQRCTVKINVVPKLVAGGDSATTGHDTPHPLSNYVKLETSACAKSEYKGSVYAAGTEDLQSGVYTDDALSVKMRAFYMIQRYQRARAARRRRLAVTNGTVNKHIVATVGTKQRGSYTSAENGLVRAHCDIGVPSEAQTTSLRPTVTQTTTMEGLEQKPTDISDSTTDRIMSCQAVTASQRFTPQKLSQVRSASEVCTASQTCVPSKEVERMAMGGGLITENDLDREVDQTADSKTITLTGSGIEDHCNSMGEDIGHVATNWHSIVGEDVTVGRDTTTSSLLAIRDNTLDEGRARKTGVLTESDVHRHCIALREGTGGQVVSRDPGIIPVHTEYPLPPATARPIQRTGANSSKSGGYENRNSIHQHDVMNPSSLFRPAKLANVMVASGGSCRGMPQNAEEDEDTMSVESLSDNQAIEAGIPVLAIGCAEATTAHNSVQLHENIQYPLADLQSRLRATGMDWSLFGTYRDSNEHYIGSVPADDVCEDRPVLADMGLRVCDVECLGEVFSGMTLADDSALKGVSGLGYDSTLYIGGDLVKHRVSGAGDCSARAEFEQSSIAQFGANAPMLKSGVGRGNVLQRDPLSRHGTLREQNTVGQQKGGIWREPMGTSTTPRGSESRVRGVGVDDQGGDECVDGGIFISRPPSEVQRTLQTQQYMRAAYRDTKPDSDATTADSMRNDRSIPHQRNIHRCAGTSTSTITTSRADISQLYDARWPLRDRGYTKQEGTGAHIGDSNAPEVDQLCRNTPQKALTTCERRDAGSTMLEAGGARENPQSPGYANTTVLSTINTHRTREVDESVAGSPSLLRDYTVAFSNAQLSPEVPGVPRQSPSASIMCTSSIAASRNRSKLQYPCGVEATHRLEVTTCSGRTPTRDEQPHDDCAGAQAKYATELPVRTDTDIQAHPQAKYTEESLARDTTDSQANRQAKYSAESPQMFDSCAQADRQAGHSSESEWASFGDENTQHEIFSQLIPCTYDTPPTPVVVEKSPPAMNTVAVTESPYARYEYDASVKCGSIGMRSLFPVSEVNSLADCENPAVAILANDITSSIDRARRFLDLPIEYSGAKPRHERLHEVSHPQDAPAPNIIVPNTGTEYEPKFAEFTETLLTDEDLACLLRERDMQNCEFQRSIRVRCEEVTEYTTDSDSGYSVKVACASEDDSNKGEWTSMDVVEVLFICPDSELHTSGTGMHRVATMCLNGRQIRWDRFGLKAPDVLLTTPSHQNRDKKGR
ncbi:hypothetical protein SARC_01777 [Sphaeroforma arctica JP610]|uniref:Uncharacterized protein n=1 Tax=Sphaeroforma arctica JP610 TaxID=667725 RepID=A0A0L0GAK1_9EUKA|nr:hypothetical protein SARC_01777 [Sphaeroforma arctica JP610]KNC86052.1 hypothetical protein SARC_01777 [Sphaeroforma arctica JP610]|eukprot:XP_014159954.1 hypothetical protein SARC_01777 [Sphaeroforma arctica JP610]